MQLRLH